MCQDAWEYGWRRWSYEMKVDIKNKWTQTDMWRQRVPLQFKWNQHLPRSRQVVSLRSVKSINNDSFAVTHQYVVPPYTSPSSGLSGGATTPVIKQLQYAFPSHPPTAGNTATTTTFTTSTSVLKCCHVNAELGHWNNSYGHKNHPKGQHITRGGNDDNNQDK